MKNNLFKFLGVCLLGGVVMFQSCTEDEGTGTGTGTGSGVTGPSLTLETADGFITSTGTAGPGDTIYVKVTAAKGDDDLRDLEILDNSNSRLAVDHILIDGEKPSANAVLLTGDDVAGFTKDVGIIVGDEFGSFDYTFKVTATDNESTSSETVTIEVENPTPLTATSSLGQTNNIVGGGWLAIPVSFASGAGLKEFGVKYNDVAVENDYVSLSPSYEAISALPYALDSVVSMDTSIYLKFPDADSTINGVIYVVDNNNDTVLIERTFNVSVSSDLTEVTELKVYNNAGANFGGLDLDGVNGPVVISSTQTADVELTNETTSTQAGDGQFDKKLQAAAGVTLKKITSSDVEGFTYSSTSTHTALESAYTSATTAEIASGSKTDVLIKDDMYIVKKGDSYYLLLITNIVETPTVGDNNDYIELSVKYKNS